MIAVTAAGQTDTAWKPSLTDSIYLSGWDGRLVIDTLPQPKYDTVAIIYLYCDTAVLYRDSIGNREVEVGRRWFTYWDFGYEVRSGFYGIIGYLDRQKNPIRKSMIIWQTRPLKE